MRSGTHEFSELSARLTGFSPAELAGTGMVGAHFDTLLEIVGEAHVTALLADAPELSVEDLLDDPRFGPLCRNVIVMWYLGQWDQLPADWRRAHGASAGDVNNVVSAEAYTEGLVWPTIGSHPQAAKQPGFGSWALPPGTGSYGWGSETQVTL